ncbi:MAG: ankyrin repeat domain-containing protein [Planctomycetales bacterium]|nr:ankyrin repeat domain-containing protein [Planctomycetales bacterium]
MIKHSTDGLRAILFFASIFLLGCVDKPVPRNIAYNTFLSEGTLGHFDGMERLLKLYPDLISERREGDETLLHAAAMGSHPGVVKFLLKHGAEINVANKYGETPLLLAVRGKRLENVVILLNAGADLTIGDNNGMSPLDVAAQRGLPEIIRVLAGHGADVNQVNKGNTPSFSAGKTPLIRAAEWNQPDAVDALLACKAEVNVRDSIGGTALMFAIDRENGLKATSETAEDIRIVKSLLAAGADPESLKINGQTPRSLAKKYKDRLPQIAKLLGVE